MNVSLAFLWDRNMTFATFGWSCAPLFLLIIVLHVVQIHFQPQPFISELELKYVVTQRSPSSDSTIYPTATTSQSVSTYSPTHSPTHSPTRSPTLSPTSPPTFDFYIYGADMSYLNVLDCYGTCSFFKTSRSSNTTEDALLTLKNSGVNTIRMRIWNNPKYYDSTSENEYCNLTNILHLAKRVVLVHNMSFVLDFHYSDTWADPDKQYKPKLWSTINGGQELIDCVYNFTFKVLTALLQQNTLPKYVQIGNEIDNGMLWGPPGKQCKYGGYVKHPCESNFGYFAKLINAGCLATRDISSKIEIIIHTSFGNSLSIKHEDSVENIVNWYARLLNDYNVDFDSIGLSFYLGYCGSDCRLNSSMYLLKNMMKRDELKRLKGGLYIVETSFPYNSNVTYKWHNDDYDFTPQGQLEYWRDFIALLRSGNIYKFKGIFWWGTEYWHSNDFAFQALWDSNGIALPALLAGFM